MMQKNQHHRLVPTPGEHLCRCVQGRGGTCLAYETHVLCFDEQLVRPRSIVDARE